MAQEQSSARSKVTLDGNPLRNQLLLGLPPAESSALYPLLHFLEMPSHFVLHEAGKPIEFVYFVNSGLASVLTVLRNGRSVEVGLVGREGFVGLPVVVGLSTSPTRVVAQVAGSAFRLEAVSLAKVLPSCPQLERRLNRFIQILGMQATQVAACNQLHEVDARLARWLLMSQDRLGHKTIRLTQEFLAHMLGTRRASVTVAAGHLQKKKLIKYSPGEIEVVHRAGLEKVTCECYAAMNVQYQNWRKEV